MRAVFIAIATFLLSTAAGAQPVLYYPADGDHVFLWTDAASDETIRVTRAAGRWRLEGTPLAGKVWAMRLARIAGGKPGDDTSGRALDVLLAGQVPAALAAQRLPDAHALFVRRGNAVLLSGTSGEKHFDVPFTKPLTLWTKTAGIDLASWLGLPAGDDPGGGKVIADAVGVQVPTAQTWPVFWDAAVTRATSDRFHASTYPGNTDAAKRWLLIESGGPAQLIFDRVKTPMPALPLPKSGAAVNNTTNGSGGPQTGGQHSALWEIIIAFGAGLVLGASVVYGVFKLVQWRAQKASTENGDRPPREITPAEVDRFADALRPHIMAALSRPPGEGAAVDIDAKARAIADACNESGKTAQAFDGLSCNAAKAVQALDTLPERLKSTAAAVAKIESALSAANAELTAARQREATLQTNLETVTAAKKTLEAEKVEAGRKLERFDKVEKKANDLETVKKTLEDELKQIRGDAEKAARAAALSIEDALKTLAARDQELAKAREDVQRLRKDFVSLGTLGERLQDGQKNHYSERQNGPAAAMLGFLANHSLHQLSVGIGTGRAEQRRYMLLNLRRIARALPSMHGYQRAHEELEKNFEHASPPAESEVKRPDLRGEAPMFQFALRYLRESVNVDLAPYYFFVDEDGLPYRAA
jgi:hypothetical protein